MIDFGIFNHNCNDNAIKLASEFKRLTNTYVIDSGSSFKDSDEESHFDKLLPNIYYCGMINEIIHHFQPDSTVICFIASDVNIKDTGLLYQRLLKAFEDPKIGIYAPSVNKEGSNHPQMHNKMTNGFRKALFVDGFCFAARIEILKTLFPINIELNKIGWGVDVYLSYLALKSKMISVVDDAIQVEHFVGPNNHTNPQAFLNEAKMERARWFKTLPKGAQHFKVATSIELLKNQVGANIIHSLPW